jgi:hypothetical protein
MKDVKEQLIQAIAEIYKYDRMSDQAFHYVSDEDWGISVNAIEIGELTESKKAALDSMQQDGCFKSWEIFHATLCVEGLSPGFCEILEKIRA